MLSFKEYIKEAEDPCWDGYQQIGMKKKGGREVPNCVPEQAVDDVTNNKKENK